MLNANDLKQIADKGITPKTIEEQLDLFRKGFPFLRIAACASISNGITKLDNSGISDCIDSWNDFLRNGGRVVKFVPASGAASRMFKNLFEFMNEDKNELTTDFIKTFFANIKKFAFYADLSDCCSKTYMESAEELLKHHKYVEVIKCLLTDRGMNYGALPKALLEFHKTGRITHTPLEEHLEEGVQYAKDKEGNVAIHFTVSPEHKPEFIKLINEKLPAMESEWGVKYDVSMSEQRPSTDTIAVNLDNKPYREDGKLLFRPAGHGALLENLNEINADVVFVKNIDNVVPKNLREETIKYKMIIGGYLIKVQRRIAKYLKLLESGGYSITDVREMIAFLHNVLNIRYSETKKLEDSELVLYIQNKLNRPIRVCGMVKNDGEPGGGPYIVYNQDGSTSPQILESAQFDKKDSKSIKLINEGTHFNPVDLVCYIKDYKGNKFDLKQFVDKNTGLISEKSKSGTTIKALELPGLWNGSMSDWNTVFIDVPLATFNPVKTVNDLLRKQHQG